MCDLRYIEDSAVLGFSNRKRGIPLLNDGPKRLANLIGLPRAADTIIFDREINAQCAVDLGIAIGPVKNGTGNIYSFFLGSFLLPFCYILLSFFGNLK